MSRRTAIALGTLLVVIGAVVAAQGLVLGNAFGVVVGVLLAGLGGGRAYLARRRP